MKIDPYKGLSGPVGGGGGGGVSDEGFRDVQQAGGEGMEISRRPPFKKPVIPAPALKPVGW